MHKTTMCQTWKANEKLMSKLFCEEYKELQAKISQVSYSNKEME